MVKIFIQWLFNKLMSECFQNSSLHNHHESQTLRTLFTMSTTTVVLMAIVAVGSSHTRNVILWSGLTFNTLKVSSTET